MAIGGVVINFVAKTAAAVRDTDKLTGALKDVGKSGKDAGGKRGIGGLVSSMGAAVPVIGAAVIGAVGAAAAFVDMGKAALEDKKQADNLANTLKSIPGVTQKMIDKNAEWIDGMELATLVSDTELRAAISKLTLATGDLGEAQRLAALSADVAAGSGKSYATVAAAMAKAAAGNTAQLTRMFPWLDANHDKTVTLAEATTGLGDAYDGAAGKAAKNDPWKRLEVIWDQLQEALGEGLLPVIKKFGDWFADPKNRENIQKIITKVATMSEKIGTDAVKAIQKFVDWLKSPEGKKAMDDFKKKADSIAKAFDDVASFIDDAVSAIKTLITWINKIPLNPLQTASWILDHLPGGSMAAPAASGASPGTMSSQQFAPPTFHVNVTLDQWGSARVTKRAIAAYDRRQGRPPNTPLRVAW